MTAHFETISDLYNKHSYLYKRGRVPEKKAKPTFFISIAEKQGASSYWVIDENDKFILWKFDAGSIFEELDKNKKAFKRYESDTERILLEWIE